MEVTLQFNSKESLAKIPVGRVPHFPHTQACLSILWLVTAAAAVGSEAMDFRLDRLGFLVNCTPGSRIFKGPSCGFHTAFLTQSCLPLLECEK